MNFLTCFLWLFEYLLHIYVYFFFSWIFFKIFTFMVDYINGVMRNALISVIIFSLILSYLERNKCLSFFFFFLFLKATPVAYGGSQAMGQIRAVATSLHHSHSNDRFDHVYDLHYSSWQHQIFNPLRKPRVQTCVLMDTSRVH